MIIKNNNKAVDVQKERHVCWEGQKTSRRFYVKKTETLIKTEYGSDPSTIPNISWEGGTTQKFNLYRKETYSIREGFTTRTEERIYNYPNATFKNGDTSGCTINNTPNQDGPYTFNNPFSVTFSKRDNASSDRTIVICAMGLRGDRYDEANITITQTKRDKYVTKLDNASITTDLIPASGGNISSGKLTFRKTYNTGESETVTENVTFSTVSATTKGTTESPVTNVTTIPAGGTIQKQTTIDGVTLTHPSFTVKQAANTKSVMTPESKKTTSVILSVSPTTVYSSGGTVTFSLQRKYTLNKVVYQYTSGSTSGGGSDANQGPEAVNANQTYTITGITGVSSTKGTSYKIPASTSARTIKFKTTYDGITSNEVSVTQKLDGPDESKAFTYSNLTITKYSYATDKSGYHFPASGRTISATDCTLEGTYKWTYTSMENKSVTETVKWTFNDLTAAMYTFSPTSVTSQSLSTSYAPEETRYAEIYVILQNLKHTYNGKQYDVKDSKGTFLKTNTVTTLTRQGNNGTQASNPTSTELSVSVSPTSFTYTGGTAALTATLIKTFKVTWTSGATSTNPTNTNVTSSTTFAGTYIQDGEIKENPFSFSGSKPVIPNIQSSKTSRTYTFTGTYNKTYTDTATLTQTGNTILHTVTFHINSIYAKWSGSTSSDTIKKQFSHDTPYTDLKPDETPTWIEGSDYKYTPNGKYSLSPNDNAVTSNQLLTSNIDLYVVWEEGSPFIKLTWDPNGGTFLTATGSSATTNSIYKYYNAGRISCQPKDLGWENEPTKSSSVFLGWTLNGTTYNSFPITIQFGSPSIFYASYKSDKITITWYANGGLFSNNSSSKTQTITYNSNLSAYSEKPSKASTVSETYTFKGWSKTSTGSVVTFPITNVTEDTTFYAIYTITAVKYTVTWSNTYKDKNLVVFSNGEYKDQTTSVNYNTAYTSLTPPSTKSQVNITANNLTDTVYQVAQWFDNNDFNTLISKSSKKVTGTCTVYLKYQYTKHRLTLNSGPAKFYSTQGSSQSTDYNALIDANTPTTVNPGFIFVGVPAGKEFIGWSKNASSTSADISSSTIATTFTISAPTTYYAIFAAGTYTITWQAENPNVATSIWSDGTTGSKTSKAAGGTKFKTLSAPGDFNANIYNSTKTIKYTNGTWWDDETITTKLANSTKTVTANTTVYATFTSNYKVTFNGNSGIVTANSKNTYETYLVSLTYSNYKATKTGYTFKGWSKTSNGATLSGTVKLESTLTLYAIWEENSYTITWSSGLSTTLARYGIWSDNTNNNKTSTAKYGDTIKTLTAPATLKTYIEHDDARYYLHWYIQKTGTANFTLLSNYTGTVSSNLTIYAMSGNDSSDTRYKISLYGNGGTLTINGTNYSGSNPYIFYDYTSVTFPTMTKTRTGYNFNNWSTSSSATTGETYFSITGPLTLYAIWKIKSYTVTWSSNIDTTTISIWKSGETGTKTSSANYGTKYSALSEPSPSVDTITIQNTIQYQSNGNWYTESSGGTNIKSSTNTIANSITVYKQYSIRYKVILNCNGGQKSSTDSNTTWEFFSSSFQYSSYVPVRSNYTFNGWASSSSATSGNKTGTCTVTAAVTYYATWSRNSATINWNNTNSNIAIWSDKTKDTKTSSVNYGTKYSSLSAPSTLANPIKNDNNTIRYTGAWYTASSGGTLLSNSSATVTSNPTNVYLQLTIASYKVILNPNNGTLTVSGKAYTSSSPYITYTKGSFNLENYTPIRTGYIFKGWGSTPTGNWVGSGVTINSSITYYALWQQLWTVTWNLQGGNINGDTSNKTETVADRDPVSFEKYTPVKTGYTFNGWATSSTATSGNTSGSSSPITADTTFYATWKSATLTPILLVLA